MNQSRMLAMEEKTSAFYLVEGIQALSGLDKATGFYPLALGLVASGLERLLKLDIIVGTLRVEGVLPKRTEFRNLSHDLERLAAKALVFPNEHAELAKSLLDEDEILASLLAALSEFAKDGRYLYMDRILNPESRAPDPTMTLRKVERAVLRHTSATDAATESWIFAYGMTGEWRTFIRRRNEFIVESLLRFLRALIRLFVDLAGTSDAGYLRIFLEENAFGRPPSRPEFRRVASSPELEGWELELETLLAGS